MVLEFWVLLGAGVESEGDFSLISVLVSFLLMSERISNLLDTVRAQCSMMGLNFFLSLGFVDLWAKTLAFSECGLILFGSVIGMGALAVSILG